MSVVPLFVDLQNWQVLIVGGGEGALAAAGRFLRSGAFVNCWHPQFLPAFSELQQIDATRLSMVRGDLTVEMLCHMLKAQHGPKLVVLASENSEVDEQYRLCCEEFGVLTCGVDGRVTVGALIDRSELLFAVSSARTPELEQLFIRRLEREIPQDWHEGSTELVKLRESKAVTGMHPAIRENYLQELSSALLECNGRFGAALALEESRQKRKML